MQEYDIIDTYFSKLVSKTNKIGLNDDCAIINTQGDKLVVNVDTIVEDVHFLKNSPPQSIANKLLCSNLSDIASMGAIPLYWTMSIVLPKDYNNNEWLYAFSCELEKIQIEYNFHLIGGDTTRGDRLSITGSIFAKSSSDKYLLQSNAQNGDIICVSNDIGASYWGLQILKKSHDFSFLSTQDKNYLINRYNYINPQVKLGNILINFANSCTDISDGLFIDMKKIAQRSNLVANINLENIYFNPVVNKIHKHLPNSIMDSITGGDDYQLIFTMTTKSLLDFMNYLKKMNLQEIIKFSQIGRFTQRNNNDDFLNIKYNNETILGISSKSFQHF